MWTNFISGYKTGSFEKNKVQIVIEERLFRMKVKSVKWTESDDTTKYRINKE